MAAAGHSLDGDNDGVAGGNYRFGAEADKFFRYFGDSDGNRSVNAIDLAAYRGTHNKRAGQPGYLDYFDFNDDDLVNSLDYSQFVSHYNKTLGF